MLDIVPSVYVAFWPCCDDMLLFGFLIFFWECIKDERSALMVEMSK